MKPHQYIAQRVNQTFDAALTQAGFNPALLSAKRRERLLALYWQGAATGARVVNEMGGANAANRSPETGSGAGGETPAIRESRDGEGPAAGSNNGEGQTISSGDVQ